jgi:CHAD domain-containing protein
MVMLTKRRQRKYLIENQQDWLSQLKVFGKSYDQDALHRLRRDIKKIKALIILSEACTGKRPARDFRPLNKMFRRTGMIRDANNQLLLLEQRQLLSPESRERHSRQLQAAAVSFSTHLAKYRKQSKKIGRRLITDVHSIQAGCIRDWFAVELIRTGILLGSSGDRLHRARKKIKTLLYLEKLLPEKTAGQLQLNTEYLDQLQEAIGQWHDLMLTTANLAAGDIAAREVMMHAYREKEEAVRALGNDFYRKAHR